MNSNNNYNIYTFNVLNPKALYITFKTIPYNTQNNFERINIGKEIASINEKRSDYRNLLIVNIVANLLTNKNTIICLQEVNKLLLDKLIEYFFETNQICWKKDNDVVYYIKEGKGILSHTNDDFRVTLISSDLEFIGDSKNIRLTVIKNSIDRSSRNALLTIIKKKESSKKVQCINLHIHHTSSKDDYTNYAKIILDNLNLEIPFIICGDFNKTLNSISMKFFINEFNKLANKISISYKKAISNNILKSFTGFKTNKNENEKENKNNIKLYENSNKIKLSIIDHIIIGGNIVCSNNPKIINEITNKEIFYNMKSIKNNILGENYNKIIEYVKQKKNISNEIYSLKKIKKKEHNESKLKNLDSKLKNLELKLEHIKKNPPYNKNHLLSKWITKRSGKNISNHKPVFAKLELL